jgi:DNA phosphorothioation-dependent restriction protein DptG
MSFKINEDNFKTAFEPTGSFQHNRGMLIKLFPFATDKKDLKESVPDIDNFRGVTGEFYRASHEVTYQKHTSKEALIDTIIADVETSEADQLKKIITALIFNENDDLFLFSAETLRHLTFQYKNAKLTLLQDFVINLLMDEEVKELLRNAPATAHENILYKLVLEQLHTAVETKPRDQRASGFYQGQLVERTRELFKADLKNLSELQDFYVHNVALLIKYYFFHYLTQQALFLADAFDHPKDRYPLFFTLGWEKLSRSRYALEQGWKKLESNATALFAHSNTLELLQTVDFPLKFKTLQQPFTYRELKDVVYRMSEDEEKDLTIIIHHLIQKYQGKIQDVNWDLFSAHYKAPENGEFAQFHSLRLVHELFHRVRYQFENSGRRGPYEAFSTWFKTYAKSGFYKLRGGLGGTLKIDRELLLLLTEMSVMAEGKDKILITTLWEQLERRGIFFDDKTKRAVVNFFGKINTLEKKSDSGDAQYVKRLYKDSDGK